MDLNSKTAAIVFLGILFLLPLLINSVSAQDQTDYYITVEPSALNALQYLSIGRNATITFEAKWTYGPNQGAFIQNASAAIDVINQKNQTIDSLNINTANGIFSFNYVINNPDILTFNTMKLVSEDGVEWNSGIHDSNVLGLNSNIAQVYWDTFHVSMLHYDTNDLSEVTATVNVTYLLLPESGLKLESGNERNKIAHDVKVTINGVEAQEIKPGVYTANSSTFLPTAYVNVMVSDGNWTTTSTGFSFSHNTNQIYWIIVGAVSAAFVFFAVLALVFFISKRANKPKPSKHRNAAFVSAVVLGITSIISLYWGIVGLEGTFHTFNWIGLTFFGVFAFTIGIWGSILVLRRKSVTSSITAAMIPMLANTLAVKAALDMYQLPNPWFIMFASLFISIACGFFICKLEETL